MTIEEYQEYRNWAGNPIDHLVASKKWFDYVDKIHEPIREKLGGVNKIIPLEISGIDRPVQFNNIDSITYQLLLKIPKYFFEYRLTRNKFIEQMVLEPRLNKHVKWGKHIQHWMQSQSIDPETQKEVVQLVSKLGGIYANTKNMKTKMEVEITTHPMAFAKIGRYGVDPQSCFNQGKCNQHHKYILAEFPNSYVILMRESGRIMARLFGVATLDFNAWSAMNLYRDQYAHMGTLIQGLHLTFNNLLGPVKCHDNAISIPLIYQNKDINYVYTKIDDGRTTWRFDIPSYHIGIYKCYQCNIAMMSDEGTAIEGIICCPECMDKLHTCEYSNKKTRYNLVEAINADGKVLKVSSILIGKVFFPCGISKKYYHVSLMETVGGRPISKAALIQGGYIRCDSCGHWTLKELFENGLCPRCNTIKKIKNEEYTTTTV